MPDITGFIEKMQAIYGEPNEHQVRLVKEKLGHYESAVFELVLDHFFMTRKYKTWPMPAEIFQVAADCHAKLTPTRPWQPRSSPGAEHWTEDAIETANRLIKSDLGLAALDDGWLEELWHFCRKQSRLPDVHEQKQIRARASEEQKMAVSIAKLEDDSRWNKKLGAQLRYSLAKLANAMKDGREAREQAVEQWGASRGAPL